MEGSLLGFKRGETGKVRERDLTKVSQFVGPTAGTVASPASPASVSFKKAPSPLLSLTSAGSQDPLVSPGSGRSEGGRSLFPLQSPAPVLGPVLSLSPPGTPLLSHEPRDGNSSPVAESRTPHCPGTPNPLLIPL